MSYQKIKNAKKASIKGIEAIKKKKENKVNEYLKSPSLCSNCKEPLSYERKKFKFCGSSCAASFNNKKRGSRSKSTKNKISNSLKGNKLSNQHKDNISKSLKTFYEKIYNENLKRCKICNNELEYSKRHRSTCSRGCHIIASTKRKYQNGSRKTINYKEIILESTWELKYAEFLDENNISWIRPKPIKWKDSNNRTRMYYPDFYLIDYDLYVDPKNPYCMENDKEKMKIISKQLDIIWGDIHDMIEKTKSRFL